MKLKCLALLVFLSLTLTACSDALSSLQNKDDRETGEYYDGRIGDSLETAFFTFSIDNAALSADYNGQPPADGSCYLVAEITIKNTTGEEINMWSDEFQVSWGDGDDDWGTPVAQSGPKQMADEYTLKKGETQTTELVYEVPVVQSENEYSISFLEYYSDGVEGNVFFVYFDLMPLSDNESV